MAAKPAPPSPYPYYTEPFDLKDRPARFLKAFAAILQNTNYGPVLDAFARISLHCGRCAETCQVHQATNATPDNPCNRSNLLLKVYRRYFTMSGMLKARLGFGWNLSDADIDEMAEAYYRCTACRRCRTVCPVGIDHGLVTHIARWVLAEIGIVPKALVLAVREQLEGKSGNTSGIPAPALKDTLEFLEQEFVDNYGVKVPFPVDADGAEHVFFPAVSDYLLEPDVLMGVAGVMHASGGSWTIGTGYFDGINYGLFYSDRMLSRIVRKELAEVKRLHGKKILIGECGHASRVAREFGPIFGGGPTEAPPVVNIMEYTYDAFRRGALKLKKGVIPERTTYHDPCNIVRSGWIVEQPREILKHICADFVEMTPNRKDNYCCGGGSGTVSIDEMRAFRTGTQGLRKAKQIRETGATLVVSPCANCKKQIREVCEDNGLKNVRVVGLHDLVLKAIEFPESSRVKKEGPAPAGA
ncbi:MAG: (Fe-S)-binding protein [Planctomycetota bacterium]